MHLGSTEAIKLFIKTGDGVGIASKFAIGDELQANIFKQIKINGLEFKRQFYFISPQGSVPVGLVKQFITFLLRQ
jgi:DNA-binding transcriptional LysR family regulator